MQLLRGRPNTEVVPNHPASSFEIMSRRRNFVSTETFLIQPQINHKNDFHSLKMHLKGFLVVAVVFKELLKETQEKHHLKFFDPLQFWKNVVVVVPVHR